MQTSSSRISALRAFTFVLSILGGFLCGFLFRMILLEDHGLEQLLQFSMGFFIVTSFVDIMLVCVKAPVDANFMVCSASLIIWLICICVPFDLYTPMEFELLGVFFLLKLVLSAAFLHARRAELPASWPPSLSVTPAQLPVHIHFTDPPSKV